MNRAACFAAALSALPGMGPAGLVRLLTRHDPESAWEQVRSGRIRRPESDAVQLRFSDDTLRSRPWSETAARLDPCSWWSRFAERGVGVTWWGGPDYPSALVHDPQPPGVLYRLGNLDVLDRPAVAIVGTRNATPEGRAVAFELGRDLAAAGLCVVSGLALGIDGAAHTGSLVAIEGGAPGAVAGVAASGVDVPYPRRHAALWSRVAAAGVIVSENLPGRPAQAWRFPSRNRIIAGLVRLVVVVESHATGGSLITAEAAIERGVDVRVVPGPVRSPASAGSNQLLYDGPGPVRSARDVLDTLGMFDGSDGRPARASTRPSQTATAAALPAARALPRVDSGLDGPVDRQAAALLSALGWRPATIGHLIRRSGLDATTVIRALGPLTDAGIVAEDGGWWVRTR